MGLVHILRNQTPLAINYGQVLQPGEWLVQDEHAFQWAMMAERGSVEVRKWNLDNSMEAQYKRVKYGIKSILLIRSGAIGDLLLMTPAVKALRTKYPQAQICLCCFKKHWDIFAQGDMHFVEYPIPAMDAAKLDLIIPLENIIELATDKRIHATDAFAEALGVTVTDYRPVYKLAAGEIELAKVKYPPGFDVWREGNKKHEMHKPMPRLGLQIHPSSAIRAYPMPQWNAVIQGLINRGWEIMLLGKHDSIKGAPPAIKDCSALSFREAAAVLSTCDVFLGPDSSFFNLCPALGVPAIGLFGPVDWRTRIKDGSGQLALTTAADCAPCGWTNSRGGRRFPEHGPCSKSGRCEPLASITPERIVAKVDAYRK